jgi:hypothetical protein
VCGYNTAGRGGNVLDERTKVFWHEAFFEALQLELHQYQDFLEFVCEYPLSKEALIMDVLVIKKKPGERIDKNIGKIFKTHNIFEYKSETDSLTERDYNKIAAYALLYSSFTPVPVSEITVSFVVTARPRELLKYLTNKRGFAVRRPEPGIYYVEGDTFPVQILESKLLPNEENLFLRNLRSNLNSDDITNITEAYRKLKLFEKKNVYWDRLIQANQALFREAISVSEAVKELFFEAAERNGWFTTREFEKAKAIAIEMLSDGEPIEKIIKWTKLPYETVAGLV